jgi:hypothetical protein
MRVKLSKLPRDRKRDGETQPTLAPVPTCLRERAPEQITTAYSRTDPTFSAFTGMHGSAEARGEVEV